MRSVKFNTFGESKLSFQDVLVADTNQKLYLVKRTSDRRYTIEVDGQGMIEIGYESDDIFTVALFNRSRWYTTLRVNATNIQIGNVAEAQAAQISTKYITKRDERKINATFKIENQSSVMLKRLDVRGPNTQWFSILSHHNNMLMARPNGDWLAEKMTYLTDQLVTQAINNYRRSNGQEVLHSTRTAVMRRRQLDDTQLLQEKAAYKRDARELEQKCQQLAEGKTKYELEVADLQKKKHVLANEIIEVGHARSELAARRKQLQEEGEQYEKEREEFEKLDVPPPLVSNPVARKHQVMQKLNIEYDKGMAEAKKRGQNLTAELTELSRAEDQLEEWRKQLQDEKKQFEEERKEFDKLRNTGDQRASVEQGMQTDVELWASRPYWGITAQTLSNRFTTMQWPDEKQRCDNEQKEFEKMKIIHDQQATADQETQTDIELWASQPYRGTTNQTLSERFTTKQVTIKEGRVIISFQNAY